MEIAGDVKKKLKKNCSGKVLYTWTHFNPQVLLFKYVFKYNVLYFIPGVKSVIEEIHVLLTLSMLINNTCPAKDDLRIYIRLQDIRNQHISQLHAFISRSVRLWSMKSVWAVMTSGSQLFSSIDGWFTFPSFILTKLWRTQTHLIILSTLSRLQLTGVSRTSNLEHNIPSAHSTSFPALDSL
jgi:hypothetical protein